VHAVDLLDGELEVVVLGGTPRVDDGVGALGELDVRRPDRDVVRAGEHDVRADGPGGQLGRVLVRVGQAGEGDLLVGADVDGRSRRGVPDGQAGVARVDGGGVVGEGREHRCTV